MTAPLSPEQLATQRQALQAMRQQLLAQQQGHLAGQSRAEHAHELLLLDPDDVRHHESDRALDLAISDRDALALSAVESALQRLAQGRYGLCADCGVVINPARLLLSPIATRCVACAAKLERPNAR